MQKTKSKILTLLLLSAIALAIVPIANASSGNILVGVLNPPQTLPITAVPAGGNVSLSFTAVTFSGSQFYLLFSADGLSQVSSGDLRYTTLFNVAVVNAATTTQMPADANYPGQWTVGFGWINGTIPLNIPGGTFYIKAFDGATTALAVTQGIPVVASLNVSPTSGAAGTPLTVSGNAFPANSLVNVTWFNPITAKFLTLSNLTQTDALGRFNYTLLAPDLMQNPAAGDNALAHNNVEFEATLNASTPVVYTTIFTENQRGLLQIGRPATKTVAGNVMNATGLYSNLTSFGLTPTVSGTTISVGVGDTLRVVGNWFYPGAMSIKWDNTVDITPTGLAANSTGYFNTTVTVPATGLGAHNVTIIDNGLVVFVVFLNVVQSITITPSSGPIGTTVTVNGYGFPSAGSPAGTVYNATITFDATAKGWALTDANGAFSTTIVIPTSAGGAHSITATTNDSSTTSATKTFTVTPNFVISPASFYANDSTALVTASGTGFDPTKTFFVTIDNVFSPFTNTTNGLMPNSAGNLSISFIGIGFQAGMHIVQLYTVGTGSGPNTPSANATFVVLADPLTSTTSILSAINNTVTQTNSTVNTINTNLNAIGANVTNIKGNVVTLQTSVGQIQTTLTALNATIIAINGNVATLTTSIGTITTSINALSGLSSQISGISGSITQISNGVATVQTTVGQIKTELDSVNAVLGAVAGQNAAINTTLGTITTSLSSIGATVTSISGDTATIKTDLGTITGTVTGISGDTATIKTNLGTMQASIGNLQTGQTALQSDVSTVKSDVASTKTTSESLSPLIIVAIVLALIAAIAAIASIVLMRRKIAG